MKLSTLKINSWIQKGIIIGIWMLIWQGVYMYVGKELLVPSPFNTFYALIHLLGEPSFYVHIGVTLYRIAFGVVVSSFLGIALATISCFNMFFREFMKPFVTVLKSTPVMGVIILALLWFSSGNMPIFVCFLMCFPVMYTNVLTGFLSVDSNLLEMSKVYKVKRFVVIKRIYLPHTKAAVCSALSLMVGMGFKAVIAAEVLAVPKYSMGYHLLNAKVYLETAELFAWLMVIVVLSSVCEKSIHHVLGAKERSKYDYN